MQKQAPSAGRILTMVAFAGSCIGLLMFLWLSFGGTTPFAARGYRISAEFNQAVELGTQADVRISGVNVGKVVSTSLDKRTGLTRAVMELDRQYAPRPADTRAILRAKTLLGETYVELTPGSQNGPKLPDGGTIPHGQIAPTVQLDQILSTFDTATRRAFQVWMQQQGTALTNRGENLNAAIANLYPFATNVDAVLSVLRRDSAATSTLLRDGGQVFSALSQSPAQLQGFIRNSNAVFAATAAQDTALANTIRAFPPFLAETRAAINRVTRFAITTKPLIDELRPAAVQLSPALQATVTLAPELRDLMVNVGPLTQASKAGFPAFERFLDQTVPWLTRLKPYLGQLVPVIDYVNMYRRELAAFFANSTANTQSTSPDLVGGQLHQVRTENPISPEMLTTYQRRLSTNRGNPYMEPGGYQNLLAGLPVFGSYLCTSNSPPSISSAVIPSTALLPGSNQPVNLTPVQNLQNASAPPCKAQPLLGTLTTKQAQAFPRLTPLP